MTATLDRIAQSDAADPLRHFRDRFALREGLIYLDGNSLGAMPMAAPQHMADAITKGKASAALIASIVHYGEWTLPDIKKYMADGGVKVREVW